MDHGRRSSTNRPLGLAHAGPPPRLEPPRLEPPRLETSPLETSPLEPAGSSYELCASDDGAYAATYVTLEAGSFHRRQDVDVIVYLLSGSVHVVADDGTMNLRVVAGEAVYLPRGTAATWRVDLLSHKLVVSRMAVLSAVAS